MLVRERRAGRRAGDWSRGMRAATAFRVSCFRRRARSVRQCAPHRVCVVCNPRAAAIFVKWVTFVDLCEM